ncbi:MAG: phenylalanine--tRNA ligase subunit alpha [archaeon]|nr:phenylalanine--tRNA ligase subunit alpha [archaeon]
MAPTDNVSSLSEIERKTLRVLFQNPQTTGEIASASGLNIDSVRRAINWLEQKGFAQTQTQKSTRLLLTKEGNDALEKGLPEERLLNALSEKNAATFSEAMKKAGLSQQEFNVALGINKRNAFLAITKKEEPMLLLTGVSSETKNPFPEKKALEEIFARKKPSDQNAAKSLLSRGLAEEKEESELRVKITPQGNAALNTKEFSEERKYNIHEAVPQIYPGKKQPYVQFLNNIRRKLVGLGFKEMQERLINQEFYNFDVLFQPQNHPARTWTDTYQLTYPKIGRLPAKEKVLAIKNAHEHGGKTNSSGWGYKWSEEIASRLMPTAHGTAADARQMVEGVEYPRKYFVINRCFRPDVLDATHLIEFNQLDGFIVGPNLNFANLLGILKDFAKEIAGAEDVRFYPDYYPFTEPSVQLSAKHPELGWVEFAGAGIFRPEITQSLGIKGNVLAWGMGVDRLAMFKLGIKDIRHLFSDDLKWLRESKMVME